MFERFTRSTPRSRVVAALAAFCLNLLVATAPAAAATPGSVIVHEILQNPSAVADSAGEWFEVFNTTGGAIDLNGWTIRDNDSDSHVIVNGGPLVVPAGGYLVLAANGDSLSNGGVAVDYAYGGGFFLANGADELVLLDETLTEIDRVEWDGGPAFPDPNGASMSLIAPGLDNNVGANWCTASTPFGDGDLGTPGAANDCAPPVPELVINEILQNPAAVADSAGEWFEIFNAGAAAVDIDGWTIQDNDFDSHVIANGGPLVISAGGYLVLGTNADSGTNGGVAVDYVFSGLFLGNGADELVLLDTGLNEIDRVEWDGGPAFPDPNGASMSLVSPGLDNNVGANWCTASTPFGDGDLGTPGAANDCAPAGGGDLVINEIDYDQPGTDFAEFVEIKNVGSSAVDLSAFTLDLVNGNGTSVYQSFALPAVSLGPGEYFVVCGDSSQVFGCDLDVTPDSNLVQNGSPDAVAIVQGATIVDAVSYEGDTGAPYTEGSGSGLEDPGSGGVGGVNENKGISRFPDGVDTDQNNVDLSTRCITPGAANTADAADCPSPNPPTLVINEIDYDQPGTDFAEFVEIYNAGTSAADLSTLTLELINGNGGAVYQSFPLPAINLAAGDYFVVCGNAANVAECDLDVTPDSNLIQNGSPDAAALVFAGVVIDAVSYEGDTVAPYTEGSGSGLFDSGSAGQDFRGISRVPNGIDTDQNNVDLTNVCITPGRPNTPLTSGCTATAPQVEIYDVQGNGLFSPLEDSAVVTADNAVTALAPDGFFMQTPTARTDGDADTSDGIFVFLDAAPTVAVGDRVTVTGNVNEFFGFTELAGAPAVTVTGSEAPPPAVALDATRPSPDPTAPSCAVELECYEGMLVDVATGTVTGPNQRFSSDPIAEVHVVASADRAFREPGIEFPGLFGLPVWDGNPEVFELDPDKLGLPNQIIPAGSTFSAVGVLGFEFGGYELWPTELTVDPAVIPDPVRSRDPGELTVGTLNLFRLFDDVDDPPSVRSDGAVRNDFVVSTAEYLRRRAKFAEYILDVLDAPDVLAVQEAEKLGVLEDMAADIAGLDPAVVYSAFLVEGNDIGTIDVGYLVRDTVSVDAVTQLGAAEILTFDGSLLHDRPPLLLEGAYVAGGEPFQIAVLAVHNRSLNGIDDPVDGPRVRQKRLEQAQSIAWMVQDLQTADPDVRLIVTGDFNAFEFSDGYVDAVGQIKGDFDPPANLLSGPDLVDPNLTNQVDGLDAGERYSFIFRGSAQTLDHALTSQGLDLWLRGTEFGRGNADAAVDLINDAATPLRSSDHDGLVVFVMGDADGDGVPDDLDVCPGTAIPEAVPTIRLNPNHFALVDDDGIFDTTVPPGGGSGFSFTIEETAGCSCEQILDALGLGTGQRKFGCSNQTMLDWVALVNP